MQRTHTLDRALAGAEGYRRLVRLVVRAFYSGEVPPRDDDDTAAGPLPTKSKLPKHSFSGLGVLLIDHLASAKVDGYADEVSISSDLRLSQKNVRKALRYLEAERLVAAESVKFSFRRRNAEVPDDVEVEERKRQETHVFWCVDYPRFVDALRLRLLRMREMLRQQAEGVHLVQRYICPRCGADFSSLDAISLLDPASGTFRCEDCKGELVEHVAGAAVAAAGGPGTDATRRERQAFFKGLLARMEAQMKPIVDQLERLKGVDPPDYGSLQDWYQNRKEEEERRAKRLELARRRAAAGAGAAEMTEEQLMEWAERAEVVVALPGTAGGAGGANGTGAGGPPGKELPAWFRTEETPTGSVGATGAAGPAASEELHTAGAAGGAVGAEAERRMLEKVYLQQYLLQVQAAAAAGAAGEEGLPEAKRVKVEAGVAPKEEAGAGVKEEAAAKEEGVVRAAAPAVQPAAAAAAEEELEWEDT